MKNSLLAILALGTILSLVTIFLVAQKETKQTVVHPTKVAKKTEGTNALPVQSGPVTIVSKITVSQ